MSVTGVVNIAVLLEQGLQFFSGEFSRKTHFRHDLRNKTGDLRMTALLLLLLLLPKLFYMYILNLVSFFI